MFWTNKECDCNSWWHHGCGQETNHNDHDRALTTLLETARKCNTCLNYDKLQYKKQEVDFCGETYTTCGHKPAQSKVSAIRAMPAPTCKKQVQSFIGMINYLSKFLAQLSELVEPVRELCKEKVPFNWGPEHRSAFTMMKKEIAKAPVLAYYNPKRQTVLQTDASIKGLETSLLQDERPVYFASKALKEAQRVRVTSSWGCVGYGEVPSLLVHKPLHLRNRSEAPGSNLFKYIN